MITQIFTDIHHKGELKKSSEGVKFSLLQPRQHNKIRKSTKRGGEAKEKVR